ncbi:hypothetical protein GGR50DRAFT_290600 [Xylaria sp. CBS 124048]|nr:hypothetical protein GGR50DRAFT_290600 [Xylaria sp. CBS 124048]
MFFSNLLGTSSRRGGNYKPTRSRSQKQSTDSPSSLPQSPSRPVKAQTEPDPEPQPQSQSQSQSPAGEVAPRPEYIFDESQLRPATPPPNDVLHLNSDLEGLSALFPDVQVEVFREMLSNFSDESKLFVITDMLLKNPSIYVKGRRRSMQQKTHPGPSIPKPETFRTPGYKYAVRTLAFQEFKGLSRSSIEAVLSEFNYSYLDARPTLVEIYSKSWRVTISSLLFRRKPVTSLEGESHPLVTWKPTANSAMSPAVKTTGNAELDRELFEGLILPLKLNDRVAREKADRALALSVQTEEAEACEATYECACCYTDAIFEEMANCSAEGHMLCFRCIQQSITEAVFGQGWQRSIHKDTGTLRCPAVSSTECEGCISSEHIRRAMNETEKGAEILEKLDERLAEHNLLSSGLPLIRCPFCSYVEVDDLYMPEDTSPLRVRLSKIPNVLFLFIAIILSPACPALIILAIICLALCFKSSFRAFFSQQFTGAIRRYQRRRRGLRFVCQNPRCQRPSCLSCSKAWVDIHVCHESSLIALRTQVEQAMSMAIKRVCPRCSTSFVKTAGCNKLTCPCGYKMCYVCRKDIGDPGEGYQHFCQHFRPEGDGRPCTECNKCNLWETENTDAILRKAKSDAERRWRETERRELSDAEKAYLADGVGNVGILGLANGGLMLPGGNLPSIGQICDFILETFVA